MDYYREDPSRWLNGVHVVRIPVSEYNATTRAERELQENYNFFRMTRENAKLCSS